MLSQLLIMIQQIEYYALIEILKHSFPKRCFEKKWNSLLGFTASLVSSFPLALNLFTTIFKISSIANAKVIRNSYRRGTPTTLLSTLSLFTLLSPFLSIFSLFELYFTDNLSDNNSIILI